MRSSFPSRGFYGWLYHGTFLLLLDPLQAFSLRLGVIHRPPPFYEFFQLLNRCLCPPFGLNASCNGCSIPQTSPTATLFCFVPLSQRKTTPSSLSLAEGVFYVLPPREKAFYFPVIFPLERRSLLLIVPSPKSAFPCSFSLATASPPPPSGCDIYVSFFLQ